MNSSQLAESARAREEGRLAGYEAGFKAGYAECLQDIGSGIKFECVDGQCDI